MPMQKQAQQTAFLVVDALDAPHRGRVIRLRIQKGQPPSLRDLRGASLKARSPDGREERLKVIGFFTPGGKPSDARLSRTGRVDLVVEKENGAGQPEVEIRWEVTGPVA